VQIPEFCHYLTALAAIFVPGVAGPEPELAAERVRPDGQPIGLRCTFVFLLSVGHLAIARSMAGACTGGLPFLWRSALITTSTSRRKTEDRDAAVAYDARRCCKWLSAPAMSRLGVSRTLVAGFSA
jgi:hypothetical protein